MSISEVVTSIIHIACPMEMNEIEMPASAPSIAPRGCPAAETVLVQSLHRRGREPPAR